MPPPSLQKVGILLQQKMKLACVYKSVGVNAGIKGMSNKEMLLRRSNASALSAFLNYISY